MVVHDDEVDDFYTVLFLVLCPKIKEEIFDHVTIEEKLPVVATKEYLRKGFIGDDVSSCIHEVPMSQLGIVIQ